MKYLITESNLINLIKKVINENNDDLNDKIKSVFYDGFNSEPSLEDIKSQPVFEIMKPYLKSGCVKFKYMGSFLVFDVGAPIDFEDCGYDRNEANKVKAKLRKYGFNGWGVGQYAKQIKPIRW